MTKYERPNLVRAMHTRSFDEEDVSGLNEIIERLVSLVRIDGGRQGFELRIQVSAQRFCIANEYDCPNRSTDNSPYCEKHRGNVRRRGRPESKVWPMEDILDWCDAHRRASPEEAAQTIGVQVDSLRLRMTKFERGATDETREAWARMLKQRISRRFVPPSRRI